MASAAERRQIFLACKTIFSGPNALLRKPRTIERHLAEHQASLQLSIPSFDIARVTDVLRPLLAKKVFQSETQAKMEFPDLFAPQAEGSQPEPAPSATEMVAELDPFNKREKAESTEVPPLPMPSEKAKPSSPMPSLYQAYFPFSAQHSVLSVVQRVLEECCYDFAKKWLPSELEANEWDCAAAMELTDWTRLLAKWETELPEDSLKLKGTELDSLFVEVRSTRHSAVHRLPTTAEGITLLVHSAMRLTDALQDPIRTSRLKDLLFEVQNRTRAMDLNKNALENDLEPELRAIERQRQELDQKEKDLRAQTLKSNEDYKAHIGLVVQKSVERIFGNHQKVRDENSTESAATNYGAMAGAAEGPGAVLSGAALSHAVDNRAEDNRTESQDVEINKPEPDYGADACEAGGETEANRPEATYGAESYREEGKGADVNESEANRETEGHEAESEGKEASELEARDEEDKGTESKGEEANTTANREENKGEEAQGTEVNRAKAKGAEVNRTEFFDAWAYGGKDE